MKRYVGGICLIVVGFLAILGGEKEFGGFLIVAGSLLSFWGKHSCDFSKQVVEFASQMFKESNTIEIAEVMKKFALSEVEARKILKKAQRKGTIPATVALK